MAPLNSEPLRELGWLVISNCIQVLSYLLKHEGSSDGGTATNTRETEAITCQPGRMLLLTRVLPIIRYR